MKKSAISIQFLIALVLVGRFTPSALAAESTDAPAATTTAPVKPEETISTQDVMRAYLHLQEQLHTAQLAIDRTRQDAEAAAARNAETFSAKLQLIQESLTAQRNRELDAMQEANRMMLIVAGIFAGVGFLAMIFTAWLQWRAAGRLTELVANLPQRAIDPGWNPAGLGAGDAHISVDTTHGPNLRLSGAIERLEKRILELEHAATPPLKEGEPAAGRTTESGASAAPSDTAARITLMLGKGQSLLNLDKADEAVACFDEVLTIDGNNTDALVKKGVALERQRKLNEAIECYDRAIAADDTVAIAYLYKGGICNRLERFSEALECYEHALRAQEKRRVA